MNINNTKVVILAMNTGNLQQESDLLELRGFNINQFKPVIGYYNGTKENSWTIRVDTDEEFNELLDIAHTYHQESILIVHEDRSATLHYVADNSTKELGRFINVPKGIALSESCYTYDLESEAYFITKE